MSPKDFKRIREGLALTQVEMSKILGLSDSKTIAHYETGFRTPSLLTRALMRMFDELPDKAVSDLIGTLRKFVAKEKGDQRKID